jgi:hypothetical protein
MDGKLRAIHAVWIPAVLAGMTGLFVSHKIRKLDRAKYKQRRLSD